LTLGCQKEYHHYECASPQPIKMTFHVSIPEKNNHLNRATSFPKYSFHTNIFPNFKNPEHQFFPKLVSGSAFIAYSLLTLTPTPIFIVFGKTNLGRCWQEN